MKAAQISKYSKELDVKLVEIEKPNIQEHEVLIKVIVAALNPLDIMNITGSVRLIQDYKKPFTLGNELSGIIKTVGSKVTEFKPGDRVYARLPVNKIGAIAEYVAVDQSAIWFMPKNLDFERAAAIPLTGLTAYQAYQDILKVKAEETVLIPGGSGSFGQLAVPLGKHFGLNIIVTGNKASKERVLATGATQYLDYRTENYWETLSKVDYVIDTVGTREIDHEFSVLNPGGKLLSLIAGPNKEFATRQNMPFWKKWLFTLAGSKLDKKAAKIGAEYRFIFVQADGTQLQEITRIVEQENIVPVVDPHQFTLNEINAGLNFLRDDHPKGKVIIHVANQ